MVSLPVEVVTLMDLLTKLEGVGSKTAQRYAFFFLKQGDSYIDNLINALNLIKNVKQCQECCTYSSTTICEICSNFNRDRGTICIVESPKDAVAIEQTRDYKGLYHILHGLIDPLSGIGPGQIKTKELTNRILTSKGEIKEVILALNSTVEGDTTSLYLQKILKVSDVKLSKIATGIAINTELDNADIVTLSKALSGRQEL